MIFINDLPLLEVYDFEPRPFDNQIQGYCVYGYLRESTDEYGPAGSLRYVGEGAPSRPLAKHAVRVPDAEYIVILKDRLDKNGGVDREKILVSHYGRIDLGTGILENRKEGGRGWGTAGKKYPKQACKYCGVGQRRLTLHEKSCKSNPNRVDGITKGVEHNRTNCQYCDRLVSRVGVHEKCCEKNPNRVVATYNKIHCKHCFKLRGERQIVQHESTCEANPARIESVSVKENCQYCDSLISVRQLKRHERHCRDKLSTTV